MQAPWRSNRINHPHEDTWTQLRILREHVAGLQSHLTTLATNTLIVSNKIDGAASQMTGLAVRVAQLGDAVERLTTSMERRDTP